MCGLSAIHSVCLGFLQRDQSDSLSWWQACVGFFSSGSAPGDELKPLCVTGCYQGD